MMTTKTETDKSKINYIIKDDGRGQLLTSSDFNSLSSPGSYKMDSEADVVLKDNTKIAMKKLYEETPLTMLFFSDKNISNIQNLLKYNVYKEINL